MKRTFKTLVALAMTVMMLFTLVACSGTTTSSASTGTPKSASTAANASQPASASSTSAQNDVLKIGMILEDTGGMSAMGPLTRCAVKMALERYNNGVIAGRKVEVICEDDASDAAVGVQKAQKLIEESGCKIICGPQSGSVATAVKGYAGSQPNITFVMGGGGDTMTYGVVYPNVFRICVSGAQSAFCLGKYALSKGYKKVLTVGPDNDFQYSLIAGFKDTFILGGGQVESIWFPETGTDYSSMIAKVPKDVDAVLLAAGGSTGSDFIKQFREYGFDLPIISGHSVLDANTIGKPALAKLIEGSIGSTTTPADGLSGEYYEWYAKRQKEILGIKPSIMAMDPFIQLQVVFDTLKACNGDISDLAKFRKTMAEATYETPRGKVTFDMNRQVIATEYLVQVVKDSTTGEYGHKILETYPNQTQFGPFDPTWYAAQPLPSRDKPTAETIKNAVLAK